MGSDAITDTAGGSLPATLQNKGKMNIQNTLNRLGISFVPVSFQIHYTSKVDYRRFIYTQLAFGEQFRVHNTPLDYAVVQIPDENGNTYQNMWQVFNITTGRLVWFTFSYSKERSILNFLKNKHYI